MSEEATLHGNCSIPLGSINMTAQFVSTNLLSLLLLSCAPLQFSGSKEPTDHVHMLDVTDIAYAEDDRCLHQFSPDPALSLAADVAYLNDRGVVLMQLTTPVWPYATALKDRVLLPADYSSRTTAQKARIMGHERVHYCQRDEYEKDEFDRAYALSNNRFRFEVPAYRMNVRMLKAHGASQQELCSYIEARQATLPDGYWLHDLEPVQFEAETRRIWEQELDAPCP